MAGSTKINCSVEIAMWCMMKTYFYSIKIPSIVHSLMNVIFLNVLLNMHNTYYSLELAN